MTGTMGFWKQFFGGGTEEEDENTAGASGLPEEMAEDPAEEENRDEEEPVLEVTPGKSGGTDEEAAEDDPEEPRSFSLAVEAALRVKDDERGLVVIGMLFGKIRRGDPIYIYTVQKPVTFASAVRIEDKPGHEVTSASNQMVGIYINELPDIREIMKYSVLSSRQPVLRVTDYRSVENPALVGLARIFRKFQKDQNYINLLVYEICHAQFIIPTTVEVLEETGEDGRKKTRVGIPAIAKKDDPSVRIFPLFTDVREMVRWRGLAEGGHQLKVLPLNFKTAVSMMKNGYSAIGMNSFSNSSLVLSKEMITSIVNSEGYRREFS